MTNSHPAAAAESSGLPADTPPGTPPDRREALTAIGALVAMGTACLTPLAAAAAFLLDPILRPRTTIAGAEEGRLPVGNIADLPADGTPQRVVLSADRLDAWSIYRRRPVGSIFLRRIDDQNVLALSDICPHLGCKVEYKPNDQQYLCPCHGGQFKQDGERLNEVAPRAMDVLEVLVKSDGSLWVRYQEFEGGTPAKRVLA